MRRSLCILQLSAALLVAQAAHAQDAKARAEALFEEAQSLMKKGDLGSACPKFAASQKLDPAVGTLINLATCYERQGKTASAWASFHEVAISAQRAGQDDRAKFATKRAADLEKKLSRVVIKVTGNASGLEVRLDGTVVDSSEWGSALPLDPGQHAIDVSAPGKRKWSTTVDVGTDAMRTEVAVPTLADEIITTPEKPVVAEIEPPPAPSSSSPLRPIGLVVGAVGLVGVGVGFGFGINAKSKNDEALAHCPQSPKCNDQQGVDLTNDAKASATAATISVIVGGVLLATGITLFLVAPHGKAKSVTAIIGPNGAGIGGTF